MKYVDFFGNKVSKLIVGDNPFNGHSYIATFISGHEMMHYYTEEKILEAMQQMEELGINTMLPLADPYVLRVLNRYRERGGKMNFIFQTYGPMMVSPETAEISIKSMLGLKPLGIYISGTYNDVRFETGRTDEIKDMIKLFRNHDIKLGMGTHHPELITLAEQEKWDVDFYMACMYNLRRGREGEESGFITGKDKSGIHPIRPNDREIMLKTLKGIEKPIIAFKIFAGGQMLVEHDEEKRKELITDAYDTIFNSLKPDDFAVMGIFNKYHDQLAENVSIFNQWAER